MLAVFSTCVLQKITTTQMREDRTGMSVLYRSVKPILGSRELQAETRYV